MAPLAVFGIVVVLGVSAVAIARPVFMHSVDSGLSDEYDEIALNIATTGRFSASPGNPSLETVMRGPVYPFYLAGLRRAFGGDWLRAVGFSDFVLHGLSAALLVVALQMFAPAWVAVFGGLLFALWPTTFYYVGKGSSETMLTLWMTAAFLLLLRLMRTPVVPTALGLGVAIGLGCLTRGSGVVMLFIALVWLCASILRRRASWRVALVLVAAWAITMAPWWARNARVTGAFVPFHSLVWYNAFHDDRFDEARRWLSQTGRTRVDWGDLPADAYPETVIRHPPGFRYPSELDARADLEQEARYREIMMHKFRMPGYLIRKVGRNAVDFWSASASVMKSRVLLVSSIAWLLIFTWGTWRARRERAWFGALLVCHAAIWLTFTLYLPFLAIFRHSIPAAPFIAFVIALGVGRARPRRSA